MSNKKNTNKGPPIIENRKARFNYEIIETVEAGLALLGTEVKSLRQGRAHLQDSYAIPLNNEMVLLNAHIEKYDHATSFNHNETRSRKLLMKRSEITSFTIKIREKKLSLIPLKMYFTQKGRVKVLLGLGRGKKNYDKRESQKKSEAKREIDRALKESGR